MKLASLVLVAFCFASCRAAEGQSEQNAALVARMGQVVVPYVTDNSFMGSILVARGKEILLNKGYGKANLDWDISNAPDVRFRIGSITKQFTAVLVLLLQQDGKLNVNDPVSKYLPDAPASWKHIKLVNLLGHTSGIPDFTDDPRSVTWSMSTHTPAEEVNFIRDKPLDFEPGSKFSYSSSNYILLGYILERVTGISYGQLLRERLIIPLGLSNTGMDADDLILHKRASGYLVGIKGLVYARSESMSVPYAAGGMYSTTGDLLKWEHALFGHKVLSDASLKLLTTPGKGDYGFGLFIVKSKGVTVIFHNGGDAGFSARLAYVPERRIAVIVLGNVATGSPQAMGDDLMQLALGRKVTLPNERKVLMIYASETPKFAGTYELADGSDFRLEAQANMVVDTTGGVYWPLDYLGLQNEHPAFFLRELNAVFEFIPDPNGAYTTFIFHRGGVDDLAKRK